MQTQQQGRSTNQKVKRIAPMNVLEKLLYHAILLRAAPDHRLILVPEQEADRNHAQIVHGYTGHQPRLDWCTLSPATPIIVGCDGPQMSMSSRPTCLSMPASPRAICAENVLLPTPPLPDKTKIVCLTSSKLFATTFKAGSSSLARPEAHNFWFGHPAQPAALPAESLDGPTQPMIIESKYTDV